jgi:hypothetical protein
MENYKIEMDGYPLGSRGSCENDSSFTGWNYQEVGLRDLSVVWNRASQHY